MTGGDQFQFTAHVAQHTSLCVTTQACERIYRALSGQTGRIRSDVTVETGARLIWVPQETILFDGSAMDRRLTIDLAPDAVALIVEPMVYGRPAMGETLRDIRLSDRITISRDGAPLFIDATRFDGNLNAHLARPFIANGAGAMALIALVSPSAPAHLTAVRNLLPDTAGASLIRDDLLIVRLLADDSMALRHSLLPVLDRLNPDPLPRCWTL